MAEEYITVREHLVEGLRMIADAIEHNAALPPGMVDTIRKGADEIVWLDRDRQWLLAEHGKREAELLDQDGEIERLGDENRKLRYELDGPNIYHAANERQARMIAVLETANERLRSALKRIAQNTCCNRCQEAALVARASLDLPKEPCPEPDDVCADCGYRC